jgi:hypothetical protein
MALQPQVDAGAGERHGQRVGHPVPSNRLACISRLPLVPMRGLAFYEAHDSVGPIRYQSRDLRVRQGARVKARDSLYHLDISSAFFDDRFLQNGARDRLGVGC